MYADNIEVLNKHKYANGIDKYDYFKKFNRDNTLFGSIIDSWFVGILSKKHSY
ncbi:hypothetical protein O5404_06195 (plasmid) [Borrelia miyamotoi]|uniref:Uncharacterized protein n=1 Tax=Borrelia miyamotoi TaxID=47466 RepID=A0AAX3JNX3_9SPIR|nr:hypothetical protein [Borrelia miyamotoi]WAZ71379.1 hypothetical protein O5403_06980 [Borrelia miyamotoi]WAZ72597.1 hypothetical protein O5404_06195 [Borrelia miyamotoi]WCB91077.1 hypothetical protein CNO11_07470 [Borrelia miyamotoi]WVI05482.1 hypothetical protein F9Y91_01305 [Borrelia miyamotoi]